MGVRYIKSIEKIFHRNCVSRKNTIRVAKIKPTPYPKKKSIIKTTGSNRAASLRGVCVINIIRNSGIKDKRRLMQEEIVREKG